MEECQISHLTHMYDVPNIPLPKPPTTKRRKLHEGSCNLTYIIMKITVAKQILNSYRCVKVNSAKQQLLHFQILLEAKRKSQLKEFVNLERTCTIYDSPMLNTPTIGTVG